MMGPDSDNRGTSPLSNKETIALAHAPILRAIEKRSGAELIDSIKRDARLAELYGVDSGSWEQLTIEEHTRLVLSRLERYPFLEHLPSHGPMDAGVLMIAMAFHDLGKFLPDGETCSRDKTSQHARTISLLNSYRDLLPLRPHERTLLGQLINGDPINDMLRMFHSYRPKTAEVVELSRNRPRHGWELNDYLQQTQLLEDKLNASRRQPQRQELEVVARILIDKAALVGINPELYLYYQTVYYQLDASSYTYDARCGNRRGELVLDFLFERSAGAVSSDDSLLVFDDDEGRLLFSSEVEEAYKSFRELMRTFGSA